MYVKELTRKQRTLLDEYADEGKKSALCCDPIDETVAREYGGRLMKWLGRDCIATVICDGPFAACRTVHMLAVLETRIDGKIPDLVWNTFARRICDQIDDRIKYLVLEHVHERVWHAVGLHWLNPSGIDRIGDLIRTQCEASVWTAIKDQIWEQTKNRAWDRIVEQDETAFPYLKGQWLSGLTAWYRYYRDVLRLDVPEFWQMEDQTQFGGVFPLEKFVVIFRRPEFIHLNTEGNLHCDGGPALRYADGFSLHALNGVSAPEWLAVKREDEIDPREFAGIENAELRREFVRKVGIERIVRTLGAKTLDKHGDYELLSVDLGGRSGAWPYLKMLNPSIGAWHLEAVDKKITTVEQAIRWRNQSDLNQEQLT